MDSLTIISARKDNVKPPDGWEIIDHLMYTGLKEDWLVWDWNTSMFRDLTSMREKYSFDTNIIAMRYTKGMYAARKITPPPRTRKLRTTLFHRNLINKMK